MQPIIVIPAYQPTETLCRLVNTLRQQTQYPIIVVNDGSSEKCNVIFEQLTHIENLHLIQHAINLGKGQALKTAMNFALNTYPEMLGIVTADADGQHTPEDILKLAEQLTHSPNQLWLGARQFEGKIPLRSQFGNTLTRYIFRFFTGTWLFDTQTGLRAIPKAFLYDLLKTPTSGYDFELDMLILATREKLPISEIPIETIYTDNNASSHFNPITDSFKIYFVFFRFLFFSILSGIFDFIAFSITYFFTQNVLVSECLARVFSGTLNFSFNKSLVFRSNEAWQNEALKYTLLCLANIPLSYGLILGLQHLGLPVHIAKIVAMVTLFIANFAIQKAMVFTSTIPSKRWELEKS